MLRLLSSSEAVPRSFARHSNAIWTTSTTSQSRWSGFVIRPIPYWTGTMSAVSYSIRIKRSAARELGRIPRDDRMRIIRAIDRLAEQPLTGSVLKGGLRGLRRVRVGRYRVLYEVLDDALVVLVVRVSHRREAYRSR